MFRKTPESFKARADRFYAWEQSLEKRIKENRFFKFVQRRAKLAVLISFSATWISNYTRGNEIDRQTEAIRLLTASEANTRGLLERTIERDGGNHSRADDLEIAYFEKVKEGDSLYMMYVSAYYEKITGIPFRKYAYRTDFEVHDSTSARMYYTADTTVIGRWDTLRLIEPYIFPDGRRLDFYVKKWPVRDRMDTLLRGWIIPLNRITHIIDPQGHIEVIKISPDSMAKGLQDTIVNKSN